MKYIVMSARVGKDLTMEVPIVFPNSLVHAIMADNMVVTLRAHQYTDVKVVAAGTYTASPLDFGRCSGESKTLGISSRGEDDEKLIAMCDYGVGIY